VQSLKQRAKSEDNVWLAHVAKVLHDI
jgi:hypothetical protein